MADFKTYNVTNFQSVKFKVFPGLANGDEECSRMLLAEVESSRTFLASRTHFEVLGLEASSPWPWPQSLRSSKTAQPSARG